VGNGLWFSSTGIKNHCQYQNCTNAVATQQLLNYIPPPWAVPDSQGRCTGHASIAGNFAEYACTDLESRDCLVERGSLNANNEDLGRQGLWNPASPRKWGHYILLKKCQFSLFLTRSQVCVASSDGLDLLP